MTEQIGLKCVYTEEILVKYTTFLKEYFFVNFYKPCSIEGLNWSSDLGYGLVVTWDAEMKIVSQM